MINMQEYHRLSELGDRIKSNLASQLEKDEYMHLLLKNGSIDNYQYQQYINNKGNKQSEDLIGAALTVGAIILLGYILKGIKK